MPPRLVVTLNFMMYFCVATRSPIRSMCRSVSRAPYFTTPSGSNPAVVVSIISKNSSTVCSFGLRAHSQVPFAKSCIFSSRQEG